MPWKTILTVVLFIGAMLGLKLFELQTIPLVWSLPLPKPPDIPVAPLNRNFALRVEAAAAPGIADSNLVDPTHQLDHFYAALDKGNAVAVHYGDSPTTADLITADARAMLQKEYGDGGSGFVLIARPWAWYGHRGVEMESSNWKIDVAGVPEAIKDGLHGLGAASFRGSPGAVAHWTLKDPTHTSVEISFLKQPGGGSFSMSADKVEIGTADTDGEQGPGYATFTIPPGSKEFTLRVTRGSVRLYGADFRKAGPGVVYSSVGVNGANITLLSHAMNGPHWAAELRHFHPNLVVIAFGTNESGYPSIIDGNWGTELRAAVRRIQAAVPEASVLLMSPMDRGERKTDGTIGTIDTLPRMVVIETNAAADTGAAFFNTYQAMGGEGTMAKWYNGEPRLVGADFIHPMPGGAKIVGELLYNALRNGYNGYKLRQLRGAEAGAEAGGASTSVPLATEPPKVEQP